MGPGLCADGTQRDPPACELTAPFSQRPMQPIACAGYAPQGRVRAPDERAGPCLAAVCDSRARWQDPTSRHLAVVVTSPPEYRQAEQRSLSAA